MDNLFRRFYRDFYNRTGGFIPTNPLNQCVYPGDFFQIRNGEMVVLGNIFRHGIINGNDVVFPSAQLNPSGWNFGDGVTKPYSGRGSGHGAIEGQFEFSRQVLAFANKGSFFFKAENPESVRIDNWNEFQQPLLIKMTQTLYSFRELYVVTESATAQNSTLAIAGAANGELEIASDAENFGLVDIFGHHSSKTIQSKEIEYYQREDKRKPVYFKAKKLTVQDEKLQVFISDFINRRFGTSEWANDFFEYGFHHDTTSTPLSLGHYTQACLLDMLQSGQLNPNTALLYFKWTDANLDDVEKFFLTYGN